MHKLLKNLENHSVDSIDLFDAMILENTDIHELIYIVSQFNKNNKQIVLHDSIYACRLFSLETVMQCNFYDDIIWLIDNAKYTQQYVYQMFLVQLNESLLNLRFKHPAVKSNNILHRYIIEKLKIFNKKTKSPYPYSRFGHTKHKEYNLLILQQIIDGYSFLDIINSIPDAQFCEYISASNFFTDSFLFQHIYQDNIFFKISPLKQYTMLSLLLNNFKSIFKFSSQNLYINISAKFFEQILCTKEINISQKYLVLKTLQNIINTNKIKYHTETIFPYIAEIILRSCKSLSDYIKNIENIRNESSTYPEFMLNLTCAGIPLNDKISLFYIFSQTDGNNMHVALDDWCNTFNFN